MQSYVPFKNEVFNTLENKRDSENESQLEKNKQTNLL